MINRFFHLSFFLSISLACNEGQNSLETESTKPNIIFILADDLGYGDLSCYGQSKFQTPHIDRLAREGKKFTAAYAGATVCAPSRSSLMTGLHTGHTFIRGNKEWQPEGQWPIPDSAYTLAELLQTAGYKTGAFGKWGLGFIGTSGDPNKQGFDHFFGYNCQRLAHNYYPEYLWDNHRKIIQNGNQNRGTEDYGPAVIHKEALKFIRKNKKEPFFLFYPSVIPHAELLVPDKYMDPFRGKFDPEKKYEGVDEGEAYRKGPYGSQAECHAAFAGMIGLLDEQVGEILDLVDSLNLVENTIIIFTSDNGPHLEGGGDPDYFDSNGPFTGYKRDLYEGGIRVPLLIKWTNKIAPSSETDVPVAFWDFFPTLAEISGVTYPQDLDGVSLVPLLKNVTNSLPHRDLYWEFHERGGRQAMRSGKWKLVRYDLENSAATSTQLFNLMEDPSEKKDLSSEFPDTLNQLLEKMESSRIPNADFPLRSIDQSK